MRPRAPSVVALLVLATACHRAPGTWMELGARTGCTPELLARTATYDSTSVRTLVGTYRLVQVDTATGWLELRNRDAGSREFQRLRLWAADSVTAHWRYSPLRRAPMRVNRPIVGALSGYERAGFTSDVPQVEIVNGALDYLEVRFSPEPLNDGSTLWLLPIQRLGTWGFGGYYREASYVVPAGPDGKPLDQRAGYYCAFREDA